MCSQLCCADVFLFLNLGFSSVYPFMALLAINGTGTFHPNCAFVLDMAVFESLLLRR